MTSATESMLGKTPLLMLIDGHALVHRAFHAFREPLHVRSTGEEVSAVFGFLNMLLKAREDWHPTHCAIAFDLSAPTFRHAEYEEYKAHRPPTPPELRSQFDRVRQLVSAFGIPVFEKEGYEADDVLGDALQAGRNARDRDDCPVRGQRPAAAGVAIGAGRAGLHRQGWAADL